MASVSKDPNGTHRICFTGADGKRRAIWLGACSLTAARSICTRVEQIVADQRLGIRHDQNLSQWLHSCPSVLRSKLVKVGLVDASGEVLTITQLFARIEANSTIAPATAKIYGRICGSLVERFGSEMRIDQICSADAERWQVWLRTRRLGKATVAKYTNCVRGAFNRAVRWKLIDTSPFAQLKSGAQTNPSRQAYVSVEVFNSILATEDDPKWIAVYSLLRFAGLRCPSEVQALRWSDLDLRPDKMALRVRSRKTEHHEGREQRTVPIFPELQPMLFDYVRSCKAQQGPLFPSLPSSVNLRNRFQRMMAKAGVAPWPRLFQNLRASFATDLVEHVPSHMAAAWCGHTVAIQQSAYMIQRDTHFKSAVRGAFRLGGSTADSAINIALTAQNPASHGIAQDRKESHEPL